MSGESADTYKVGYGKPPKATRFQKGKSGNPSGRPKKSTGSTDLGSILDEIENEEISVLDNGKRKQMKKAEINFRQLFKKAIDGDLKSGRLLVQMAEEYFTPEATAYRDYELIGVTEAARRFGSNYLKKIDELNRLGRSGQ
jgi:Family of unknown function (DUF5681)